LAGFCSDEVDNQGLLFGFCVKLDISADFGIVDSSYFMNICSLELNIKKHAAVIAPGFGADMGLGAYLLLASGVASLLHVGLACINPDRVSLS